MAPAQSSLQRTSEMRDHTASQGLPPQARKFVSLLGVCLFDFSSDLFIYLFNFIIVDKMSVHDVIIEQGTLMAWGALQKFSKK